MKSIQRIVDIYLCCLLPPGVAVIIWACAGFPFERLDAGLIALSILTIFFSSALRIQLPRTKIHLTVSDALVFLSFLLYGGQVSVLLAALEMGFTSLVLRRQGLTVRPKTAVINVLIAVLSIFVSAVAVGMIFGKAEAIVRNGLSERLIWLLVTMALGQFLVNSIFIAGIVAGRTGAGVWRVWYDNCLNALVMSCIGVVIAGLCITALQQIDLLLLAVVIGFFAIVYLTYKRSVDDVKRTGAQAEEAERVRAEQAEAHVKELEHYVAELEKSSRALEESREKFRHAAYHDPLTDLPNRNYFIERIDDLLQRAASAGGRMFAVLYIDLQRFKTVNDSLGHSMGDRLITQVATRLSQATKDPGMVGRFGGDEFAIILPELASVEQATVFAKQVAEAIAEPFVLEERVIFTKASIGIAIGAKEHKNGEDVLRDADIAMYKAKEKNRSFVIFDQRMLASAVSRMELETDLRLALLRDEFEVWYQPIVDLERLQIGGFEALIRWNHPHLGRVGPDRFIPVCEVTGLVVPITLKVMETACRQLAKWQSSSESLRSLFVSVNISGTHFGHPALVEQIREVLKKTGLNPHCLKLEITETAVMENAESAVAMLRQIKELGVRLCIDDFGTGYSSLGYLQRFPIDTLKVDRVFVRSMEDGRQNGEIVRAVLALSDALNLQVVAEGIESIHQYHQLRILSCKYGQGYLFSEPLAAADAGTLLTDQQRWQRLVSGGNFVIVSPEYERTPLRIQ